MIQKMILIAAVVLMVSCKKETRDPCMQKANVQNCTELFEEIQNNLHDPVKLKELRDCYDQGCQ